MHLDRAKHIQIDTSGLVAFSLLAAIVPWSIWNLVLLVTGADADLIAFNLMAGTFMALGVGFCVLHGLRDGAWASAPVLLTVGAINGFVLMPSWQFLIGNDRIDPIYVRSMALVLASFVAFWIGSLIAKKKTNFQFRDQIADNGRIAIWAAIMAVIGLVSNVIMWRAGLLGYMTDEATHVSALSYVTAAGLMAKLLLGAMVVSSIERFAGRKSLIVNGVFWISLAGNLIFGTISGMKSSILLPVLIVTLVAIIVRGKMPKQVVLLPVLLFFVYPFVTAYRENLLRGYRWQANTFDGLAATAQKTIDDVMRGGVYYVIEPTVTHVGSRLSLLAFVRDVIGLPAPELIAGDEKLWMAPIYPLIPRAIWKDKPELVEGRNLSVALGHGRENSAAPTPIGDLYVQVGAAGTMFGMFLFGVGLQVYMNSIGRRQMSARELFFYLGMLTPLLNLESDATVKIAATVQTAIAMVVATRLIYGPSRIWTETGK